MKQASLAEWKEIGNQSKVVQEELIKLMNLSSGKMPTVLVNHVIKSIEQLANFKFKAEDRMLKSGVTKDLTIFFGSDSNGQN